ncbi:hypothetical protein MKK88_21175 [Methylobacterium sp. E-005]|uniref:hypothetical protein n=1 Tax=Methylobacterium sp. E-005 TaxID=2836549 RepID=UPI001FB998C8|nr:hypothetical protein [Methylobacterium sp. E-005]MCJ2088473.1 hypothetical protein [Methylobacterium sp. E-005]
MSEPLLRSALAPQDEALLRVLDEKNGYALSCRCIDAGLPHDRRGLAAAHKRMIYLEREELVRRLDDGKPIIWLRTAKGTAEIAARAAEGS